MDNNLIPVDGHRNLYRDESTGAIINIDYNEYSNYINLRNERKRGKMEIENLKRDVDDIKTSLNSIIEMLMNKEDKN